MRFYDILQLNPTDLKNKIKAAETRKEKNILRLGMVVRAVLLVLFCVLFVAPMGSIFGPENNPMAVALLCILLAVRFVDFEYNIKASVGNLGIAFLLLALAPSAASLVPPAAAFFIHFAALMAIVLMTSENPVMGNGGLYGFSYVFLAGNPVTGILLYKRLALTLFGFLLCAAVLYGKHRQKHTDVRFRDILKGFRLSSDKSRWQLRLALGISLILALGASLHIERYMWMGFAASSLLAGYTDISGHKERCFQRMLGVLAGSGVFLAIYYLVPSSLHGLLGPAGGLLLGFCTQYHYKTMLNCLGALLLAAGIYGAPAAVFLRIQNNLLGVISGFVFILIYHRLIDTRFSSAETAEHCAA